MKQRTFWITFVLSLLFLFALYFLFGLGIAAQRTYTYSVLKEIEDTGGAITDIAQQMEHDPLKKVFSLSAIRTFQSAAFYLSFAWISVLLVIIWKAGKRV